MFEVRKMSILREIAVILTLIIPPLVRGQLHSIGPVNITRSVGENNVYIPCPFSGQYNPFWRINQVFYEAYSLPKGMIAASYGLLLPSITWDMNGTSFQCFVSDDYGVQNSSVGTLSVEGSEFQGNMQYFPNNGNGTRRINLDHQHTIFDETTKTFAWKGRSNNCSNYRIVSTTCDGMIIRPWDGVGNNNMLTVQTSDLITNDSTPLFFKLESLDGNGNICGEATQFIDVDQSDVTRVMKVAHVGLCVDIQADSIPYVIVPYNLTDTTDQPDCFCPILITDQQTAFDITHCSCISKTLYSNSILVTKVPVAQSNPHTYEFCFTNLSMAMNTSVVHFIESLRYCTNRFGRSVDVNHRRYRKSFQILVVLPNPPVVKFNINETGQVQFISSDNEEISLDHYQIIIRDATGQAVFNETFNNVTTSTSIVKSIQQSICSPFILSAQAHNSFGYSEVFYPIPPNIPDTTAGPCLCISQNVVVELNLLDEDGVKVNCSQSMYKSNTNLTIRANKQKNITISCDGVQTIVFSSLSLECDKSHLLEAYYYAMDFQTNETTECIVQSVVQELPCQDSDKMLLLILVYTFGAVLGCIVLTAVTVVALLTCCFRKKWRKRNQKVMINEDALTNSSDDHEN